LNEVTEYRVEDVAAEAGISVEVLRSYQSKGLLPQPRHEGRVAFYDDRHLARLREILDLKHQGYSLRMIGNLLGAGTAGGLSSPAAAASAPVLADTFGDADEEPLTLREVAERVKVHPGLLRSLEASGVLIPLAAAGSGVGPGVGPDDRRYSLADVRAVRMLLSLISGGLPIEEFMRVARTQIEASDAVAQGAIDLFMHYVRDPMIEAGVDEDQEAEQLVAALALMLQATTTLISYNFQRRVLNGVTAELERRGAAKELAVLWREARRRGVEVLPA
jgi:DNA-binding transcriptional MerR regulator